MITADDIKAFLDISGSADDTKLAFALGANQQCARFTGRTTFLNEARVDEVSIRRPGVVTIRTRVQPVLETPRLQLVLFDVGFRFTDSEVDASANTIRTRAGGELGEVPHSLATGDGPFRFVSTGSLPGGLSATTDYFAIVVDAKSIKLATSRANATAGTAVDITASAGSGVHRIIGPTVDEDQFHVQYPEGIVNLGFYNEFPQSSMRVAMLYTSGFGASASAVKTDHPGLHGTILRQGAFLYRQMGKTGRLGLLLKDSGGQVTDQYIAAGWAPGVTDDLAVYKVRRL